MKERFKGHPVALQKQILYRLGLAAVFLLLFFIMWLEFTDEPYLYVPCLLIALFLSVDGGLLLFNTLKKKYLAIEGKCEYIEVTGIRKRVKSVTLIVGFNRLIIPIRQRMKRLAVGDTVIVYVSDKAPVYEYENGYVIDSYYAIEYRKE